MQKRSIKDYAILYAKGIAMGSADIVPGVSGGTIAFITGIYEELINSIKSINATTLRMLLGLKIKAFLEAINFWFLFTLLAGIGTALVALSSVISHALETYPVLVWSFFFGLILASTWFVARKITAVNAMVILFFLIGGGIAYYITVAVPVETPNAYWFVFISGVVAICAMILPGISGSFILLLMGKYHFILDALRRMDIVTLLVFIAGCTIGITSFARVISWLFSRYHNATLALLTGFMLGSLNKVWPWKQVTSTRINSKGEEVPFLDKSVWPADFDGDPQVLWAILLCAGGFLLIWLFELMSKRKPEAL